MFQSLPQTLETCSPHSGAQESDNQNIPLASFQPMWLLWFGGAWRGGEEPPPFPSWQTECRLSPISGPQDPVSVQILVCEEAAVLLRRRQMLKRGPAWALWPHPKARQACLHPPSENSDPAPPCILSLGDLSQTQVSLCELVFQAAL